VITAAIALLIGIQGSQQASGDQAKLSPSQILSKMFAHYAEAKSAVGTIKMTQTAVNTSVHITTDLQFERPSLIFLRQVRDGSLPHQWYLTSDGKEFSYDHPSNRDPGLYGKRRMVEYVTQHSQSLTVSDFLNAATYSLGDMNPMIISAIGSKEALKKLIGQWATLNYEGRITVDGQIAQRIVGQYRETSIGPIAGQFEADISETGDFMKYVLRQRMMFPKLDKEAIEVTTTWESSLKVDATTDKALYKVVQ